MCALTFYSDVCQLFLTKTGEKIITSPDDAKQTVGLVGRERATW